MRDEILQLVSDWQSNCDEDQRLSFEAGDREWTLTHDDVCGEEHIVRDDALRWNWGAVSLETVTAIWLHFD